MTQRQAALFGGGAALLLVIAIAGTMSAAARRAEQPGDPVAATSTAQVPEATSTVATATSTATSTASSTPPDVIGARIFVAGDLAADQVLASRRSTDAWPMASLTKLMTATIALRDIAADEPIVIVPVPGGNPSRPVLPAGETFAMRDVLAVMLVASSNEAAESLAAHVGRERFLGEMNAAARAWGLQRTAYADASGLSPGNKSTGRELLTLVQRIHAEFPEVFQWTRRGSVTVHAQGTGVAYTAYATHELVRDPGFLGGKTGYTDEARGNLLSLFQVGPRIEALIVLGSDDRFGDTRRLLKTLKQNP